MRSSATADLARGSQFERGLLAAALFESDAEKAGAILDELSAAAKPRGDGRILAENKASAHLRWAATCVRRLPR